MMSKALSCTGFVPDLAYLKGQVSDNSKQIEIPKESCTDHQLVSYNPGFPYLTVLKSLGFFLSKRLKTYLRILRLSANIHVERGFECFGFVPDNFPLQFAKQSLFIFLRPQPHQFQDRILNVNSGGNRDENTRRQHDGRCREALS